jgi:outer membrane protein
MKAALFAAVLALFSSACFAQAAPSSPANGIVTKAFNTAVLQTNEAQRELSSLQAQFAPRQAHLEALNVEIETLQKQAATDPTKVNSINAKEKQLQREGEDFRTESQMASEQTFQAVAQKVYAFLQEFSSQHGYTAVIERGSNASPVVWYAAANLDITKTVVDAYNARAATSNTEVPRAPSASQGARQQNK